MKKYLAQFAATLILAGGFMTSAHAIPVTINMTADNVVIGGGLCSDVNCTTVSTWGVLNGGPLANVGNWKQSDSLVLDLGAGTHYFAWNVTNNGTATSSNPAALLAEILWGGNANYSSSNWDVITTGGSFLANATEYGLNGGANIWTSNNSGGPVAGISTNANWIYSAGNGVDAAGSAYIRTSISIASVPEPGVLGLFGVGLIGLAMTRRKRTV